jgi:predicted DNA-binding ribbon-helix-helix protein
MKITATVTRTVPTGDGGTTSATITVSDEDHCGDGEILASALRGACVRWINELVGEVVPDTHPEASEPRRAAYILENYAIRDPVADDDDR